MAAAFAGNRLHLAIGSSRTAHPDVFPYSIIKQIAILGHIGHFLIVTFLGQVPDIHTANLNTPGIHVPQSGNQLGNGGLAAAGRTNQCIHGTGRENHTHPVEHFLLPIAKAHIFQRHRIISGRGFILRRPGKFRLSEHLGNFPHNGLHLANVVRERHAGDQGLN